MVSVQYGSSDALPIPSLIQIGRDRCCMDRAVYDLQRGYSIDVSDTSSSSSSLDRSDNRTWLETGWLSYSRISNPAPRDSAHDHVVFIKPHPVRARNLKLRPLFACRALIFINRYLLCRRWRRLASCGSLSLRSCCCARHDAAWTREDRRETAYQSRRLRDQRSIGAIEWRSEKILKDQRSTAHSDDRDCLTLVPAWYWPCHRASVWAVSVVPSAAVPPSTLQKLFEFF